MDKCDIQDMEQRDVVLNIFLNSLQNRGISSSKLLRYPLRSATKSKEVRTPVVKSANSTLHKR
ncbi:hypothetical protein LguiB_007869 [Lonicera macranthoides]